MRCATGRLFARTGAAPSHWHFSPPHLRQCGRKTRDDVCGKRELALLCRVVCPWSASVCQEGRKKMNNGETYLNLLNELKAQAPLGTTAKVQMIVEDINIVPFPPSVSADGVYVDDYGERRRAVAALRGTNKDKTINYLLFAFRRDDVMNAYYVLSLGCDSGVMLMAQMDRSLPVLVAPKGQNTEVGLISRITYGRGV
jgi:hypothetical protein